MTSKGALSASILASLAMANLAMASPAAASTRANDAAPSNTAEGASNNAPQNADGSGTAGFGDITVTARKRAESIQDVPIAIDAFDATSLARNGVQNVEDLARLSPSLNFTKGFSPQDNEPSIRGLPGGSGRPPVAVLIDGIDTSTQSMLTSGGGNLVDLRLVDFERVEVVKGPQSALYGRSAFGGAINYVLAEPTDKLAGYVSSEFGLYGRGELRGAINVPISDTLSVRLNGDYSTYGGYYTNTVTNNKLGGYEAYGAAMSVKWTPTPDFKAVARVSYGNDHEDEQPTKYYGNANGLATNVALPAGLAGSKLGSTSLPTSLLEYRPGKVENENTPIALSADPADRSGNTDYIGSHTYNVLSSLHMDWSLGWADLSSWTGYTHSVAVNQADVDYYGRSLTKIALPYPGGLGEYSGSAASNGSWQFDTHTVTKQFSQELRLAHLDGGRLRWAVGANYWHENVKLLDGRELQFFGLGANASTWLNAALQNNGRSPVLGQDGRTTDHVSGYGLAEFDVTHNLTVSAEGRYAWERYNYLFGQSVTLASTYNLATGVDPFVLTGSPYTATSSTKYFTPRGIITWKPMPGIMTYVSASRGVKPGGISNVGAANAAYGNYKPERLSNYEFGAKGTFFQHRLLVDLAVFHMDYTNMQTTTLIAVPTTVSAQGSLSITGNAGKATIDGQEISLTFKATPSLVLSANYTHLTPIFRNYILDSTNAFDVIRGGNCTPVVVSGSTSCAVSFAGKDIANAARHAATATADYTHTLVGDIKGFAEVSMQYRGKRYVDAGDYWELKGYEIFNLKLGVQTPKWSITGYIDNLLDNRTIQNAQWLLDVPSGTFGNIDMVAYMPPPRTAGVRMRYSF